MTQSTKMRLSVNPTFPWLPSFVFVMLGTGAVCFFLDELLIALALWLSMLILVTRRIVLGLRRADAVIDGAWAHLDPPNKSSHATAPEKRQVSG